MAAAEQPSNSKNLAPDPKEMRLVIAASSAGTIFEWFDFFIYGTLAALIGKAFFPASDFARWVRCCSAFSGTDWAANTPFSSRSR